MASDGYVAIGQIQRSTSFYRRHWLMFHLLGYVVIGVSSFAMLFHFPFLRMRFHENCPLYAAPVVVKKLDLYSFISEGEQGKDNKATVWGNKKTCDYVFTMSALSFISAFVWCWFFWFCSVGNKWEVSAFESKNQKWQVVPPAMALATLMSILTFVSSCTLSAGLLSFCNTLEDSVVESCSKASNSEWFFFTELKGFYEDVSWSISEAWIIFVGWLMQTVMLFVHCLEGPRNGYVYGYSSTKKRTSTSSF